MTSTAATAPAVPRGIRLGYGVGSFCTATFGAIPGLLLLYYMTNILAVPAWLAGVVVFAPKAWDLAINTLVGQWSDRTVTRWGARRPWILAGAAVLPVTFALTFIGPPLTGLAAAAFVGVFFLIASTGYAFFEVPYKAMPAEMTSDYHERTSLLQWRMVFIAVAVALSGILAPAIAGQTLDGYRAMGVIFGIVLLSAMLVAFFGTAKAPLIAEPGGTGEAEMSLRAKLTAAKENKPFLWLVALSSAQYLATGIMLAGAPYFASYTLGVPGATSTLFAALVGPMLITMPLWVWLARRLDKRGAMNAANVIYLVGALANVAAPLLSSLYAHLCVVLVGVGYAGMQLLQFSMLADVIAHDTAVSGRRRGGVFTGVWTSVENLINALGAFVFGFAIALGGFISSDPAHPVTQSSGAHLAIVITETVIPAVVILAAILMTTRYRLSAEEIARATARDTA